MPDRSDTSAAPRTGSPERGADTSARRLLRHLPTLLVAVAVGGVHLALADPGPGPRVLADEVGYLADAVQLGTGQVVNMRGTAFYSGGWPLLLAPLARLHGDDRLGLYHAVVVLQVLLAVLTTVVLVHLVRRVARCGAAAALAAGAAGGLFPAYAMHTGLTWSEAALTAAVTVAALATWWLLDSDPGIESSWASAARRGALCGAALGGAAIVHRRLLVPVLLVLLVLVAWALLERRRRSVAIVAATSLVVVLVGRWLDGHLAATVWSGDTADLTLGSKARSITSVHGVVDLASTASGQVWYLLVASGGLVGVAVLGALLLAWRGLRPGAGDRTGGGRADDVRSRAWFALSMVVLLAGLVAVGSAFVSGATARADYLVYGRYAEVLAPLFVAGGVAWLLTARRRDVLGTVAITVAVTVACWAVVDLGHRAELDRPLNPLNLAAVVGWIDLPAARPLLRGTIWASAALVAMGVISVTRWRRHASAIRVCGVAAIVLALFGWQITRIRSDIVDPLHDGAAPYASMVAAARRLGATRIAVDPALGRGPVVSLSYRLPHVEVDLDAAVDHGGACLLVTGAAPPGDEAVAGSGSLRMVRRPAPCAL